MSVHVVAVDLGGEKPLAIGYYRTRAEAEEAAVIAKDEWGEEASVIENSPAHAFSIASCQYELGELFLEVREAWFLRNKESLRRVLGEPVAAKLLTFHEATDVSEGTFVCSRLGGASLVDEQVCSALPFFGCLLIEGLQGEDVLCCLFAEYQQGGEVDAEGQLVSVEEARFDLAESSSPALVASVADFLDFEISDDLESWLEDGQSEEGWQIFEQSHVVRDLACFLSSKIGGAPNTENYFMSDYPGYVFVGQVLNELSGLPALLIVLVNWSTRDVKVLVEHLG